MSFDFFQPIESVLVGSSIGQIEEEKSTNGFSVMTIKVGDKNKKEVVKGMIYAVVMDLYLSEPAEKNYRRVRECNGKNFTGVPDLSLDNRAVFQYNMLCAVFYTDGRSGGLADTTFRVSEGVIR